jgi:hypothetical protein
MDLPLYLRVLWRFRVLVAAGLLLAVALACFSYVNVDLNGGKPHFSYRDSEQWESLATIAITSQRFNAGSIVDPETRSLFEAPPADAEEARRAFADADPSEFANLSYLNQLTTVLMPLATSDAVFRIIRNDGGGEIRGALQTFPVTAGDSLVPMITFSAIATSPQEALSLARRHTAAFKEFVTQRQNADEIPELERVVVQDVRQPQRPVLLEGRKKTRPIIVFLTVMTAVLGLAFVLENMRPRVRPIASTEDEEADERRRRRSA